MSEILSVNNLKTYYFSRETTTPAVDGVSFTLQKGEVLGIVGESGSGKSTVARSILSLYNPLNTRIEDGEIIYSGRNLLSLNAKEMNKIRGRKISMIFQNPVTSLNPVFKVGAQLEDVLKTHTNMKKAEIKKRVIDLFKLTGIPSAENRVNDYPHELSGGMQQRVMIASALACNPDILVADEPTTSLDVTIQAQILSLMNEIKATFGMGILLISHDLGVIAQMTDRVIVMYGGVVVEEGETKEVLGSPSHPYTQGLLKSIPNLDEENQKIVPIPGSVERFSVPVKKCRFYDRCPFAFDKCKVSEPPLKEVNKNHKSRCWL